MKRSEITPGQDYLVSSAKDWEDSYRAPMRVRVLDSTAWTICTGYSWGRRGARTYTLSDGTKFTTTDAYRTDDFPNQRADAVIGVAVDAETGQPMEGVKPRPYALREIRGPWAAMNARRRETQAARRAHADAARARREANQAKADQAVAALKAHGVTGTTGFSGRDSGRVVLDADDVLALLERLA